MNDLGKSHPYLEKEKGKEERPAAGSGTAQRSVERLRGPGEKQSECFFEEA